MKIFFFQQKSLFVSETVRNSTIIGSYCGLVTGSHRYLMNHGRQAPMFLADLHIGMLIPFDQQRSCYPGSAGERRVSR